MKKYLLPDYYLKIEVDILEKDKLLIRKLLWKFISENKSKGLNDKEIIPRLKTYVREVFLLRKQIIGE